MDDINIKPRKILSVFEKIHSEGEKTDKGWLLDGVYADSGHDGYDITLEDGKASVTLHFHNTISVVNDNEAAWRDFLLKLEHIDQAY